MSVILREEKCKMDFTQNLRKMTFDGKTYNVLTDEELQDLIIAAIYDMKYDSEKSELVEFKRFVKERNEKYGL